MIPVKVSACDMPGALMLEIGNKGRKAMILPGDTIWVDTDDITIPTADEIMKRYNLDPHFHAIVNTVLQFKMFGRVL